MSIAFFGGSSIFVVIFFDSDFVFNRAVSLLRGGVLDLDLRERDGLDALLDEDEEDEELDDTDLRFLDLSVEQIQRNS